MLRSFIILSCLASLLFASCDKTEECYECKIKLCERTRVFNDSIYVYKANSERGFCDDRVPDPDEHLEQLKERAAKNEELLRAYSDEDYEGFYTGDKSIDTEADLLSMVETSNEDGYPFIIEVKGCEHEERPKEN